MDIPTGKSVCVCLLSCYACIILSHSMFTHSLCIWCGWEGIPPVPWCDSDKLQVHFTHPVSENGALFAVCRACPLWWQIRMLPITHVSTEWILSIPVLLKEWLSWLAEGGKIAICLMHVAVYSQETSSALVSHWNGPVCKEESFPLGTPQHLPRWDYDLLGYNTSRLQLLIGAGCLPAWSPKLARQVSMLFFCFTWAGHVCVAASFFYLHMSIPISFPWRQAMPWNVRLPTMLLVQKYPPVCKKYISSSGWNSWKHSTPLEDSYFDQRRAIS